MVSKVVRMYESTNIYVRNIRAKLKVSLLAKLLFAFSILLVSLACGRQNTGQNNTLTKPETKDIPYIEKFKSLGPEYAAIWPSVARDSIILKYCLPDFTPYSFSNCKGMPMLPHINPSAITVKYIYPLMRKDWAGLKTEGRGFYRFPFPFNQDLEGKTPYVEYYRLLERRAEEGSARPIKECSACDDLVFDGLIQYRPEKMIGSFRLWVPENLSEKVTRLGNPYLFYCTSFDCLLTLDRGNGWIIIVTFNEIALNDWRNFLTNLEKSIRKLME